MPADLTSIHTESQNAFDISILCNSDTEIALLRTTTVDESLAGSNFSFQSLPDYGTSFPATQGYNWRPLDANKSAVFAMQVSDGVARVIYNPDIDQCLATNSGVGIPPSVRGLCLSATANTALNLPINIAAIFDVSAIPSTDVTSYNLPITFELIYR